MIRRYKIQQDKGRYCLKGCDDGDLVDYSEYDALESRLARTEAALKVADEVCAIASQLSVLDDAEVGDVGELCDCYDNLRKALRPWRERRAQIAALEGKQ